MQVTMTWKKHFQERRASKKIHEKVGARKNKSIKTTSTNRRGMTTFSINGPPSMVATTYIGRRRNQTKSMVKKPKGAQAVQLQSLKHPTPSTTRTLI